MANTQYPIPNIQYTAFDHFLDRLDELMTAHRQGHITHEELLAEIHSALIPISIQKGTHHENL